MTVPYSNVFLNTSSDLDISPCFKKHNHEYNTACISLQIINCQQSQQNKYPKQGMKYKNIVTIHVFALLKFENTCFHHEDIR